MSKSKVKGSRGRTARKAGSAPREVQPEVTTDKKAANMLAFKRQTFQGVSKGNKTRNRTIDSGALKKKKKPKTYTEKELGIPKLNTALAPMGSKVSGRKGKVFVQDDGPRMMQILAEVQQEAGRATASKLEKSRQIEEIREAKRKEIEEREKKQEEKLSSKKKELKRKKEKVEAPKKTDRKTKLSISTSQTNVAPAVRAILSSIFFHRALGLVAPTDAQALGITYPRAGCAEAEAEINARAANAHDVVAQRGNAKVRVRFFDRKVRKSAWFPRATDVVWEEWLLSLKESQDNETQTQRQLKEALMQVLKAVDAGKERLPPILTHETVPFPYEVSVE